MVCKFLRRCFFFLFALTFGYFLALQFAFKLSVAWVLLLLQQPMIVMSVVVLAGSKMALSFVGSLKFICYSSPWTLISLTFFYGKSIYASSALKWAGSSCHKDHRL